MVSFIEKLFFLALIFSIPFQKRIFLFGPSPKGEEFFEWSSGFLYFTDFLIFALFAFWIIGSLKSDFNKARKIGSTTPPLVPPLLREGYEGVRWCLLAVLIFAFISLTQAELIDVGLYRFLKLAEFVFLFFYVASRAKAIGIKTILGMFVASGAFQSVLAILQFAKQSSLGLEIFHESTLTVGLKGVAEISAGGMEFIRAYGTFSSPNVLAGFLGLCLFFLFCLFLQGPWRVRGYSLAHSLLYAIVMFFLTCGLILTFSRGTIVFFVLISALFFAGLFLLKQFQEHRKQAKILACLVIVSWLLVIAALWPEISSRFLESSVREPAIQERLFFNEVGVDTIRQNYTQLFFGVGIGNFVHHYMQSLPGLAPHLYQPVHNIFILVASEIGILGLIAFILLLANLLQKAVKHFVKNVTMQMTHDREPFACGFSLLLVACYLLLVSMQDHYFWTIQQGSLVFWVSLGLLVSAASDYNKKL